MFENALNVSSIFSMQNLIIYLILLNMLTFLAMWIDKNRAKEGKWRISEGALFLLAIMGGSIGGIAGMYTFRHKTKKPRFKIGFPAILILEIIIYVIYFI